MHPLAKIQLMRSKPINSQASHGVAPPRRSSKKRKSRGSSVSADFRYNHSKRTIVCAVCGCTVKAHHLPRHLKRVHPQTKIPQQFGKKVVSIGVISKAPPEVCEYPGVKEVPCPDDKIAIIVERIAHEAWAATKSLQRPPQDKLKCAKREALHHFRTLDPAIRMEVEQYFVSTHWAPLIKAAKSGEI
jgi:hypothetical protein